MARSTLSVSRPAGARRGSRAAAAALGLRLPYSGSFVYDSQTMSQVESLTSTLG